GGVREAVEVAGVPLRRAYECVRLHAERRRGQRPPPWVLPRERLPDLGRESLRVRHRARRVPAAVSAGGARVGSDGRYQLDLWRRCHSVNTPATSSSPKAATRKPTVASKR